MKYLLLLIVCCGCANLWPIMPRYEYTYNCIEGNLKDTVFYSNVLYFPNDTIIEIPSRNMIVIKDIKLFNDGKNEKKKF